MGKNTKIQWSDHTFNPWWGCVKCDITCENCYANMFALRWGHDVWGAHKSRRLFGEKHWNEPLRWDKQAAKDRIRAKVFCGSMCDVFEIHADIEWNLKLDAGRERLWDLISRTPNLIWLLLTKRPENALPPGPNLDWPSNVWLGVSVGELKGLWRIPSLLQIPAKKRFLSAEPMIGQVFASRQLDWVIIGGESGQRARPFPIYDAIHLIEQCDYVGIPVFVKQMGTVWAKNTRVDLGAYTGFPDYQTVYQLGDRKGEDMSYWAPELRRREFPDE